MKPTPRESQKIHENYKKVVKEIENLVDGLCVATTEEALEIRKITNKNILCMEGPYDQKEFEMETFNKVIDLNLNSVMASCTFFHQNLSKNNGSIVIIGSGASFHAVRGNPGYSASKGGLLTLIKTLAEAWARDGIRVNGIAPGYVATKLTEVTFGNEKRYENSLKSIPLRRWGSPEDMGEVCCFLSSEEASYVTGQMLTVDGGMSLS